MEGSTFWSLCLLSLSFLLVRQGVAATVEYGLSSGSQTRYVNKGEIFSVHAYYKYCLSGIYCPSCIRWVYLNAFGLSHCVVKRTQSDLDCVKHSYTKSVTPPIVPGTYYIKMDEVLTYNCDSNRRGDNGPIIQTVIVQEPVSIVNKTNSSNLLVFEHESFTLVCGVQGYPLPVVKWFKGVQKIQENITKTSLHFHRITLADSGRYICNATNKINSESYKVEFTVLENRPHLRQDITLENPELFYQGDKATYRVILSHVPSSGMDAYNVNTIFMLPPYAQYVNHTPLLEVNQRVQQGNLQFKLSVLRRTEELALNVTLALDPGETLPKGHNYLTVPIYHIYYQTLPDGNIATFVGDMQTNTIQIIASDGGVRGFLLDPISKYVYVCKSKSRCDDSSCFSSRDGIQWRGINPAAKSLEGLSVSIGKQYIYGITAGKCGMVSQDNGVTWYCISQSEWMTETTAPGFVRLLSIPTRLRSVIPQTRYTLTSDDLTAKYGASGKGLHKEESGKWRLVVNWD